MVELKQKLSSHPWSMLNNRNPDQEKSLDDLLRMNVGKHRNVGMSNSVFELAIGAFT